MNVCFSYWEIQPFYFKIQFEKILRHYKIISAVRSYIWRLVEQLYISIQNNLFTGYITLDYKHVNNSLSVIKLIFGKKKKTFLKFFLFLYSVYSLYLYFFFIENDSFQTCLICSHTIPLKLTEFSVLQAWISIFNLIFEEFYK